MLLRFALVDGTGSRAAEPELLRCPLGDVIAGHARRDPGRVAIIGGDRQWTYGDLAGVVRSAADRVTALGGKPRPLIAVEADQRSLLAVAVTAVAAVCTAAPVAGDLPDDRRTALLQRLAPVALFDGSVFIDAEALTVGDSPRPAFNEAAIVFSTSGSTADPKLVPNTHRNLWASAVAAKQGQFLGPADRCLALGSMAHALGLRAVTDALWCGATVLIPDALTVDGIALHLHEHRPTCVVAPPPMLHVLAAAIERLAPEERALVAASVRFVRSGSAALRPAHADQLRKRLHAPVLQGYGMTEAAKIACIAISGDAPAGSVGRPLGVEVRIADDEIIVRGDAVAPGYLDDAHRSASAFEDGWFRTGDLGRLDSDGYLYVLGRRDEVVSRGGELLSLGVLEEALEAHPDVRVALATAVEHPSLGTDVVIAYEREASKSVEVARLREFLQARLPASQVPTRIIGMEELPLAASGKPSRRALASIVETGDAALQARGTGPIVTPSGMPGAEIRMASLWSNALELDARLIPEDDFFALGADSLHLVELCTMVSDAFGVEVLPGELIGHSSLRAMTAYVHSVARRSDRPILIPLRDGPSERLPLYIIPGAGGTLAAIQRFVYHLDGGRRILGFEAPGLYRGEPLPRRVPDLAARYVEELLADVRDQPFAIIGMSFGAVVVQEMARQLEAHGRPPEVLVMFDCRVPAFRWPRPQRLLRTAVYELLVRIGIKKHPVTGLPRIRASKYASRRASARHRPGPTTRPTVMFTTRENRTRTGDPLLGWGPHLLGPTTTIEFSCTHGELVRENAWETAPRLDRVLAGHDRAMRQSRSAGRDEDALAGEGADADVASLDLDGGRAVG